MARVRFWPPLPLTNKPVEGDVQPKFKGTCKFLSIFSEIKVNLSCSRHRVLSWRLWHGLGAQLSWGRYLKITHWSEATPWAASYPQSGGNKLQGKDEIHLQTSQHPGLGLGTMNSHGETRRSLDLTGGAPSTGRVHLMPMHLHLPRMS